MDGLDDTIAKAQSKRDHTVLKAVDLAFSEGMRMAHFVTGAIAYNQVKAAFIAGYTKTEQALILTDKKISKSWDDTAKKARETAQKKVSKHMERFGVQLAKLENPKVEGATEGEGEGGASKAGEETKMIATLAGLIKKIENAETLNFDVIATLKALKIAHALMAQGSAK
jgi:hypothetical protein